LLAQRLRSGPAIVGGVRKGLKLRARLVDPQRRR
jgi:hypothetical protein